MRVLVTGGNGLLGTYVARELLSAGHQVTNFGRHQSSVAGVESVIADINDIQAVQDSAAQNEAIIHLAAVTGPGKTTPEQLMHTNVIGTVNVLEAAVRVGITKVVFASSGAASGFSFQRHEIVPEYLPVDEEHPATPHDEYGLSKLLCEITTPPRMESARSVLGSTTLGTLIAKAHPPRCNPRHQVPPGQRDWRLKRSGANGTARCSLSPTDFGPRLVLHRLETCCGRCLTREMLRMRSGWPWRIRRSPMRSSPSIAPTPVQ